MSINDEIKNILNNVYSQIWDQLNNCSLIPTSETILKIVSEKLISEHQFVFMEIFDKSKNDEIEINIKCCYKNKTFILCVYHDWTVNCFDISIFFINDKDSKDLNYNHYAVIDTNYKTDKLIFDENAILLKKEVVDLLEKGHLKGVLNDYFKDLNEDFQKFEEFFKSPFKIIDEIENLFLLEMNNLQFTNCFPRDDMSGGSFVIMFDSLLCRKDFCCYYKQHPMIIQFNYKIIFNEKIKKHELDYFFVNSFLLDSDESFKKEEPLEILF